MWFAEQIALRQITAHAGEHLALGFGFYPVGHHLFAHGMRQIDGGAHHLLVASRFGQPGDEAAIDLDDIGRHVAQLDQAGVAGTKIIQRHIHAGITQTLQRLDQRAAQPAHHHGLGHLHHQRLRRQPTTRQFI